MRSVKTIKSKALLPGSQNTQYVTGVTVSVTGYNPTINFTSDIDTTDISIGNNTIPIYDTRIINAFDSANYGDRFTTSVLLTYNNIQIDDGTEGILNLNNITTDSVPLSYIPLPLLIPNLSLLPITASYGDVDIQLVPTSDSVGAYTFSVDNTNVATIVGANSNMLHIVGAGTANINVIQLAAGIYDTTNITVSLIINKTLPDLTFSNIVANYGDANFQLLPSSNSDGDYNFSITPQAPGVVTIVGANNDYLDIIGHGSAVLTVTQAETANYLPQTVTATVTVNKIDPNLTFNSTLSLDYGTADYQLNPSSDGNGAFMFTIDPPAPNVVTIVGANNNKLRVVGAGSATLSIKQAETDNYTLDTTTVSITINQILPNLTFNNITAIFGDTDILLVPTSNSDGAYIFSVVTPVPPASNVVTITGGNTLHIVGAGTAALNIIQAATSNYLARTITASVTVNSGDSGLSYNDITVTYGDPNTTIVPTSDSTGAYTFTVDNTNVATIVNSNQLNIVGAGTATLTITQARTTNHVQTVIYVPITVNKAPPSLVFAPITATYGNNDFQLVPSSYSNGAYTFSVSPSTVATIVGANSNMLHIVGSGSATLTVTQAATSNYETQTVTASVTVNPNLPNLALGPITATYGDADFQFFPSSYSNGAYTFSVSPSTVATIALPSGINWTIRTGAASNYWSSVAYGNGLWVAVADSGTGNRVMTSPDGINWTIRTSAADNNWKSVAYGNGLWVAVASFGTGTGNRVMTSPDGINWTIRTSAANNAWSSVAYGNGLWVAVALNGGGNNVMTSPDGINWTLITSGYDNTWSSVAYGNGLWVAVAWSGSGNRVMTSPDGINWVTRTSAADNSWMSVAYGNGLFVAVAVNGTGNRVMTSPDGINWTIRTSAADNNWQSVAYGNGLWVAVASFGTGTGNRVMTSPDGINWTIRTSAADNEWRSVAYGNGLWVAVGQTNNVMTSNYSINIVGANNNMLHFVAVGTATLTVTQAATSNYEAQTINVPVTVNKASPNVTLSPITATYGDTDFPLVPSSDSNGAYTFSVYNANVATIALPGVNWKSRTSAANKEWFSVAYGNGLFVAVGNNGLMISLDGITWTNINGIPNNIWLSVAYGNGLWVAVSYNGNVMTSTDGTTWTLRTSAAGNIWRSVAYGNGLWVAVTADAVINSVMTSPDGITWTSRTSASDNSWCSVAYGNGLFVATAWSGTGNSVMTSPDGINWTSRTSAAANAWMSVAYGNGLWVAVAASGTGNRVMTSLDGITWTIRTSAADNFWTSVAYGNGLWVAVALNGGGNRVMTSPDGINWTLRTSAADNNWHSVAYGNGLWVAVAADAVINSVMTSSDSINIVGAGSSTITATQAETDNYEAQTINVPVTVNKASPSLSLPAITATYGDADFQLVPSSDSNGAYTFSVSPSTVATIVGANSNMLHIVGVGTATLTVTQATTSNYEAQTINVPLTVIPPIIVVKASNGVTNKYILSSIPSGQPNPYIVENPKGSGTYYAIMGSNNANSKLMIQHLLLRAPSVVTAFTPNGQSSTVPFSNIVTTLMTDMSLLFHWSFRNFNSDISTWDTSNVTDMNNMFGWAEAFNNNSNPNIGLWDTSRVTNMEYMFYNAYAFNQYIGYWNVSGLLQNPLPGFNQNSALTTANTPFYNPPDSITSVTYDGTSGLYRVYFTHNPINSWDPNNIIIGFSFEYTGRGSTWVEQNITVVKISLHSYYVQFPQDYEPTVSISLKKNSSPWTIFLSRDQISVTATLVTKDSNGVTNKCTLSSIPQALPNPYIVQVPQGSGTYYAIMSNSLDSINKIKAYAKNTNNAPFIPNGQSSAVPFSNIVTTLMTDMSNMFYSAVNFNENLSTWDTSNVTNMTEMFYSALAFNNGDNLPISGNTNSGIGYWNTSNVTNMTEVFYNAQNFNRDIGSWDVSSVNNMDRMFGFAYNFNNGNNIPSIGSWQTLNVQSMDATFYEASSFSRDISGWTVSGLLPNPMPYFSYGSGLNSNTIPDF
jgi:surface protein